MAATNTQVRISPAVHARLLRIKEKTGITIQKLLEFAVRDYIAAQAKEKA